MLGTLLHISPKFKTQILKIGGFDILNLKINKHKPTILLLQTVLDLIIDSFTRVTSLYPLESSYVSTIINRSLIADEVINNISKSTSKNMKYPLIVHYAAIDTLFCMLTNAESYNHKMNIIRQFHNLLTGTFLTFLS
jgi:hypothetical protein